MCGDYYQVHLGAVDELGGLTLEGELGAPPTAAEGAQEVPEVVSLPHLHSDRLQPT